MASSVLCTRPSSAGVNMPTTTVIPASAAAARTALAHGPSSGSATGPSGLPKQHIVPSGNTTRAAPAAAASRIPSRTSERLWAGSAVEAIWASATRMVRA